MKTYTTKTAKNGATLYYSVETGKRIAKETALENERKEIVANGTVAERYELAKEFYNVTSYGGIETIGDFRISVPHGKSINHIVGGYTTKSRVQWHTISNSAAKIDLKREYNLTIDEFRAAALADKGFTAEQISQLLALQDDNETRLALTFSKMCEAFEAENATVTDEPQPPTDGKHNNDSDNKEETKMTIETKISANGNVNIYVDGKRTSNEKAFVLAHDNGLPTYEATCLTYADNFISESFASPVSAYRWLVTKSNSNRNFNDGSQQITIGNSEVIYERAGDFVSVNNAELEAYILTLNNGDTAAIEAQIAEYAKTVKEESLKLDPEWQRQQAEIQAELERERAEAAERQAIWYAAKFYAAKIAVDSKSVNDNFRMCIYCFEGESVQSSLAESRYDDNRNVFDMLPTVDELNDIDNGLEVADGEVENVGDAQAALIANLPCNAHEVKFFETAEAAIEFARKCESNPQVKSGYVMGDAAHHGNKILYKINATDTEPPAGNGTATLDFSDVADMFTPDVEIEPTQSRLVPDNNVTVEEPDFSEWDAELEAEMKAELAEVETSLQELQTSLEIEISEGNDDNAQVIAERIVDLNARYGHLYEQIYGHTVEIFTDPAQVIADAIEITAIVDEEQRKFFDETVAEINADKEREIAAAVADTMNADAPTGWKITPTKSGNFQILHGGNVDFVDTITAGDYLNPKEFFDQFRQTREQEDDEREADLRQMKIERDQLIEMRDEMAEKFPDDLKRLRTLNEMIDEHEDAIAAIESLLKRSPEKAVDIDKNGNVTHIWF